MATRSALAITVGAYVVGALGTGVWLVRGYRSASDRVRAPYDSGKRRFVFDLIAGSLLWPALLISAVRER